MIIIKRKLILFSIILCGYLSVCAPSIASANNTSYYLYDRPGKSVVAMVDTAAMSVNVYKYDTFGNIKFKQETVPNEYRFDGENIDERIGLLFLRARYYDAQTGRFITKDNFSGIPRTPESINPYVFVKNNPIALVDPNGQGWIVAGALLYAGIQILESPAGQEFMATYMPETIPALEFFAPIATSAIRGAAGAATAVGAFTWAVKQDISQAFQAADTAFGWGFFSGGIAAASRFEIGQTAATFLGGTLSGYYQQLSSGGNPFQATITGFASGGLSASLRNLGLESDIARSFVSSSFKSLIKFSDDIFSFFGGVSLSKTADLMLNIQDIGGAKFDEATGQVILYGKRDVALPDMKLDDLSVAVNSVYGLHKPVKDPGVSIDPDPSNPVQMKVRYDGDTFNTEFDSVMFDSDRLLKCLVMGKDNITGAAVSSGVLGYKNLLERVKDGGAGSLSQNSRSTRMWFTPKDIKLIQSSDGSAMMFDTATMQLLTEEGFQQHVPGGPAAEAFALHFTQNYDAFAGENPVLWELTLTHMVPLPVMNMFTGVI